MRDILDYVFTGVACMIVFAYAVCVIDVLSQLVKEKFDNWK